MTDSAPRPAPTRQVLLLDLSVDPDLYRPTEHWQSLLGDVPWRRVHLSAGETTLPSPASFTHLIVTGSEASILDAQDWYAPAEELVRQAVAAHRPVLGSCFGHQLIVRALLGPEHLRRSRHPELGWFPVETTADAAPVSTAGRRIWMFCCHLDEVCDLPPDWQVLARTPDCAVHAYRLADQPVWGVQAHPEINPTQGAALLRGFADKRSDLRPAVERALAAPARDDGFGRELIARFLEADA